MGMEPHIKTSPKDFFLYAFAAGALYFTATTLITLLWQLINYWMPDSANLGFYEMESVGAILRWAIAFLVIIFPAYVVAMWWIGKEVDQEPAKKELWVRRWFIWATLFIAAVTVLGDLVYLLYTFLGGDMALRFFLKAIAVGAVAKAVFFYHWYLLRREAGASIMTRRIITVVASVFVGAAVVAGFVVAGSPSLARSLRNDAQRTNDLQNIQWQITNFYQQKTQLPQELSDVIDPANPVQLPTDPVSGNAYRYEVVGKLTFKLCANFEEKSTSQDGAQVWVSDVTTTSGADGAWAHERGEKCFERTIDPERYPKL